MFFSYNEKQERRRHKRFLHRIDFSFRIIMPSPSSSSAIKRNENDEQRQSTLKTNDGQIKSDVGANIVLIGAPGSGKYFF
jgi:DNA replication protein DnaC